MRASGNLQTSTDPCSVSSIGVGQCCRRGSRAVRGRPQWVAPLTAGLLFQADTGGKRFSCLLAFSLLLSQALICPFASGGSRRHDISGIHQVSTATTTAHSTTRNWPHALMLHKILQSAPSSDSPQDAPDFADARSAAIDLDIEETIAASFIRQHDFSQLKNIDTSLVTAGSQSHQNVFHLESGSALFAPKQDITVLTREGEIHIGAGSVVLVMKPQPGVVSVFDLHNGPGQNVTITTGNESFTLSPGKVMVLTNQPGEFEKINPARSIACRLAQKGNLQSGLKVHNAEFSIPHAILIVKPLQDMLLSGDKRDRKLANQILRNAVILADVFKNAEPYKTSAKAKPAPEPAKAN